MTRDAAHPNAQMLQRFYDAFSALDAAAMAACYAEDARFEDEVFSLRGRSDIGAMWGMLCNATRQQQRDDWTLQVSGVQADTDAGRAHWEARYRFTATGRRVHNIIDARFEFRDGLICAHRDRFDFWAWSRQALGLPGWLLGWSTVLRGKVQRTAAARLRAWQARPAT